MRDASAVAGKSPAPGTACPNCQRLEQQNAKLRQIIEDYAAHARPACRDIAAVETGWCYCGLEAAMKDAGL